MYKIDLSEVFGHSKQTLLFNYCNTEINSYIEPERSGISKGDVIGPSFMKNAACILMALTNLQIKIIAESAGLSYASMRTWNTQKDFLKEKARILKDFAEFIKRKAEIGIAPEDMKDTYLYNESLLKELISLNKLLPPPIKDLISKGFGTSLQINYENQDKDGLLQEVNRYKPT